MIFHPLPPQSKPREIIFITEANTDILEICTDHGWTNRRSGEESEVLMFSLEDSAVYSLVQPKQLITFQGCHNWQVVKYHSRVQRLIYKNAVSIYPWSTFGSDPQELMPFFDALRDLSVAPASLSTMARNSWLRLLKEPAWIKEWGNHDAGRLAFIGGRKEAIQAPANYVGAHYLDLSAAYLQAMEGPVSTHLRQVDIGQRWPENGIAGAVVNIPSLDRGQWGPLPLRIGRGKRGTDFQVYGWGTYSNYWTIPELRNAAKKHGVSVESQQIWKGVREQAIFATWLPWAYDLRELPGASKLAAKMLTTRLWSLFAINTDKHSREIITFGDAKGIERFYTATPIPGGKRFTQQTSFISSIISSRVRIRLLEELLPNGAIYCDTDGGIVPREVNVPGWRQTKVMDRVEVKGAQAYRWHCPDCSVQHHPWHYSIAGMPPDSPLCADLFAYSKPNDLWSFGPYSLTVPAGEINETLQRVKTATVHDAPLEGESL